MKILFRNRSRTRIVAFIGPDGSGKTTQIRLLEEYLRGHGQRIRVKSGFSRTFEAPLRPLSHFVRLLGGGNRTAPTRPLPPTGLRRFLAHIRILIVLADCWLTWSIARYSGNRITIFDRYFYDYIPSLEWLRWDQFWFSRAFLRLPAPDVALHLHTRATIRHLRKCLEDPAPLEYYLFMDTAYANLLRNLPVMTISSETGENQTAHEVLRYIAADQTQ